ncbi:MAG: hypothetical protein H7Y15_07725 [Pseudonocardia sp.]|nr:hypothetical protein [Pseudonocardia sp.]
MIKKVAGVVAGSRVRGSHQLDGGTSWAPSVIGAIVSGAVAAFVGLLVTWLGQDPRPAWATPRLLTFMVVLFVVVGAVVGPIAEGSLRSQGPWLAQDDGRSLCEITPEQITVVSACGRDGIGGPRAVALRCGSGQQYNEMTYPFGGSTSVRLTAALVVAAPSDVAPNVVRFTVLMNGLVLFDDTWSSVNGVRRIDISAANVATLSLRATCSNPDGWAIYEVAIVR